MRVLKLKEGLSAEELKRLYQHAADKRTAQRLRAIYLRATGKTPPVIAKMLSRHEETIRNWIKLYNKSGKSALIYKATGGRTEKLTKEHKQKLARLLKEGRPAGGKWTLKELARKLLDECGVQISQQQISKHIQKLR